MLWCAHINQTNFNQHGTILDEFDLRYKMEGKYDSTTVGIDAFINDISKNHTHLSNCKIIDFNNENQKYLLQYATPEDDPLYEPGIVKQ